MSIEFLYFDLGNVLLLFDHHRAARQMAAVAGIAPERVWQIVFESGLYLEGETGQKSPQQIYDIFCRQAGCRPDFAALAQAFCDIFSVNTSMKPVLGHLEMAGYRLGLLSNTNELHWRYFSDGRYGMIPGVFEQVVLSFEVGVLKPAAAIYQAAAQRAGVDPRHIFYVDDIAANVAGARAAGFDAVQYTSTRQLVEDLRQRGLRFNY